MENNEDEEELSNDKSQQDSRMSTNTIAKKHDYVPQLPNSKQHNIKIPIIEIQEDNTEPEPATNSKDVLSPAGTIFPTIKDRDSPEMTEFPKSSAPAVKISIPNNNFSENKSNHLRTNSGSQQKSPTTGEHHSKTSSFSPIRKFSSAIQSLRSRAESRLNPMVISSRQIQEEEEDDSSDNESIFVPEKLPESSSEAGAATATPGQPATKRTKRIRKKKKKKDLCTCIPYLSQTSKIIITLVAFLVVVGGVIGVLIATGTIKIGVGSSTIVTVPTSVPTAIYESNIQVSTFSGSGTPGIADGTATSAQFNFPNAITTDALGNIYVADGGSNTIRKVTRNGSVTTLAGNGSAGFADGVGATALFNNPGGIALDLNGDLIVADSSNHKIRRVTLAGVVTTIAGTTPGYQDGAVATARIQLPIGIVVDRFGNIIIADWQNSVIRNLSTTGVISTLAGNINLPGFADGAASISSFFYPVGLAIDSRDTVYVVESSGYRVRKIANGVVSTIVGRSAGYQDGTGAIVRFAGLFGIAYGPNGNLYVSENAINLVRKVSNTTVVTMAGNRTGGYFDGAGKDSMVNNPTGLTVDPISGCLLVVDSYNHRIRNISFG